MPPVHDTAITVRSIFGQVQTNLYEAGLRWCTEADILNTMQDQYNRLFALLCPLEHSTLVPQQAHPYYNLGATIPDFMYLSGIYNPYLNCWLSGMTFKAFKSRRETFLQKGQPRYFNVQDLRRFLIWPYAGDNPTGILYVLFKAKAPLISLDHIPQFPYSVADTLLEYSTTADLLEQAREFNKATRWWNKLYKPQPNKKSVFQQAQDEIKALARADREMVLEPYRWIFHGGVIRVANQISNETPTGTINGTNTVFQIAAVPNPTSSLILTKNGQILYQGIGYTLNGQTITFNTDYIPQTGDSLRAWYSTA